MKFVNYLALALVMVLFSCENQEKQEVQTLFKSVMEVHDGVMPKMDNIHEARKTLKEKLSTADSTEVYALLEKLDLADEAMMVWMEDFNSSFETMPIQEQKKYLELEKEKITKVKDMMMGSLEETQKWVESHGGTEKK
ncbi:MAG: hypothetical protein KBF57_02385 [Saprospiraceae bacterium]|jgi:hypothetical protein|nr:hypothetical protein [Saprospiraceae bacterium]MBP9193505.1 hypothetical protein [Saprospiraceae bacterium]